MRAVPALATLVTLALSAGCAGSTGESGPEPAPDIAGTYAVTTAVQGSTVEGRIEITGEPGAYEGFVYTDLTGRLAIASVVVDWPVATLVLDSSDGPVEVLLEFSGDTITGEWSTGTDGGTIEGRKVQG